MRKIKFRAWAIENDSMIYGVDKILEFYEGVSIKELFSDTWHKIPIMQYVGLKDKKGKEIFEGDIIKDTIGIRVVKIGNFQYQDPDCFYHNFIGVYGVWTDKSESPFNSDDKELEIIGNVYENPEILTKKGINKLKIIDALKDKDENTSCRI